AGWADDGEERRHAEAVAEGVRLRLAAEEEGRVLSGEGRQAAIGRLLDGGAGRLVGGGEEVLAEPRPESLVGALETARWRDQAGTAAAPAGEEEELIGGAGGRRVALHQRAQAEHRASGR